MATARCPCRGLGAGPEELDTFFHFMLVKGEQLARVGEDKDMDQATIALGCAEIIEW